MVLSVVLFLLWGPTDSDNVVASALQLLRSTKVSSLPACMESIHTSVVIALVEVAWPFAKPVRLSAQGLLITLQATFALARATGGRARSGAAPGSSAGGGGFAMFGGDIERAGRGHVETADRDSTNLLRLAGAAGLGALKPKVASLVASLEVLPRLQEGGVRSNPNSKRSPKLSPSGE